MVKALKKKYRLYRACGINFAALAIELMLLMSYYVTGSAISIAYMMSLLFAFVIAFGGIYVYILYAYTFAVFSRNYKALCVMPYTKKECLKAFLNMIDIAVILKLIVLICGVVFEMQYSFWDVFLYDIALSDVCFQQLSCVFLTIAFICGERIFFDTATKRLFDDISDRSDKKQISGLKYLAVYVFMCFMWYVIAQAAPYSPIFMIVMALIAAFLCVASIIQKDRILDAV